jgi:hypothetical protein
VTTAKTETGEVADGRTPLDAAAAIAMLPDRDTVHVVSNGTAGVLIGADWDRPAVEELIRANGAELSGPAASGHGLFVAVGGRRLFIETRKGTTGDEP